MNGETFASMHGLLSLLALIFVLHLGFALLALSQEKQRRVVDLATPLPRTTTLILRTSGFGLFPLAPPIALWRDGPGLGSLLWASLLSSGALAITATLTWQPHWLKPLAWRGSRVKGSAPAGVQDEEDGRKA